MTDALYLTLTDAAVTDALGARMADALDAGMVIYLHGELGAGKTAFTRALLTALGAGERIKSPTYSLVESYDLPDGRRAWHLDLYRIADPGELEWLGLESLAEASALVLVEWPERGAGALPPADVVVQLDYQGAGRNIELRAQSARARAWLSRVPGEAAIS
ncbi:tRNA (adenosine(37)-N6)-threonylcarbamoyltransferase complex ATPase subunit type 1 TsaE [Oleiagrimonas sp. C23AA]|uniref:tRNA (adenosine(37)-N6)-threonylcarbamoyltransferase complex ATPase subunit type 1 TsaE n=1 Tax=Oleiagrimonas sp. C23AA TaxID=2719047 RepID=UPI00142127EC|nr:tRNA (adenosine(37)-N6)-threonylcarbamoyltransferase complex ATPase subunit type 1 TsaE [Oleiagrimonas sp. C23AA]NII09134.1 tRNA (adenosine(37)-N6)-threonylcarbamoyltransferase complex ATPase subunit type 1 TsaE [Oleiagrimonas sp. C23AA]